MKTFTDQQKDELTSGDLEAALKDINENLYIKDDEDIDQIVIGYNTETIARIDKTSYKYQFSNKINFLNLPMEQLIKIHDIVLDYVCQFTDGRKYELTINPNGFVGSAYANKTISI